MGVTEEEVSSMSAAKIAAAYIHAYCRVTWPGEDDTTGTNMASTVANGSMMDVFDHKGCGSHKYIDADKLTMDLERPLGSGVFGYWKMYDDSYILRTCDGPLAVWSGNPDDKAEWVE
jgi:hypothetical protein